MLYFAAAAAERARTLGERQRGIGHVMQSSR
jgi:hypothetical protein